MSDKQVTLDDIAKAAGVSRGTASNVFRQPEIVREALRERVKAAASKLGYSGPDPRGRLLRAGKANAIGVATAEPLSYFFDDPYARTLMGGIAQACDRAGAGIALVSAANDEKLAWNIGNALVDGFILFCIEHGPRLIKLTRERGLPFVALALDGNVENTAALSVDNVAGGRVAAGHLLELGHRDFAVLSLPIDAGPARPASWADVEAGRYSSTRDRLRGYLSALAEAGIDRDRVPIHLTDNDPVSTGAAMERIFAAGASTALLAMSDRMALAAVDWLKARGLRVPDDVSVIGFDGVPEGAYSIPPLTTVAQPIEEIGRRAVEMIAQNIVQHEFLDVELIVRGSTAPPAAG